MEPGPLGWAARMAVEMDRRVVSPRVAMVLGGGELEGQGGGDWGRGIGGGGFLAGVWVRQRYGRGGGYDMNGCANICIYIYRCLAHLEAADRGEWLGGGQ